MEKKKRTDQGTEQRITYVYGNAVKKAHAVPAREIESPKKELSIQTRKNRDRALSMNAGYVLFLAVAVSVTLGTCMHYLQLKADMTKRMSTISTLEANIADLKADNDETYKRINASINLDDIKKVAMEQLGMVYPGKDQVVLYDNKESDYVRQFYDIPSADSSAK